MIQDSLAQIVETLSTMVDRQRPVQSEIVAIDTISRVDAATESQFVPRGSRAFDESKPLTGALCSDLCHDQHETDHCEAHQEAQDEAADIQASRSLKFQ
jgi:hypothetical protein